MNKTTMIRAYIREILKEELELAVKKILPKLLGEAVDEIKNLQENSAPAQPRRSDTISASTPNKLSRSQMAAIMGVERDGDTIRATKVMPVAPEEEENNPAIKAINRNYKDVMKAMGIT